MTCCRRRHLGRRYLGLLYSVGGSLGVLYLLVMWYVSVVDVVLLLCVIVCVPGVVVVIVIIIVLGWGVLSDCWI